MGRMFDIERVDQLRDLGVGEGAISQIKQALGGGFTYYWPDAGERLDSTTPTEVERLLADKSAPVLVRVQDQFVIVRQRGAAAATILRAVKQGGDG